MILFKKFLKIPNREIVVVWLGSALSISIKVASFIACGDVSKVKTFEIP